MTFTGSKKHLGFTLIEISIVLVIIGLLTSSILVGRQLIKAAEIRKQISQIEEFNSATNTFKTKYQCLPGDCANAVELGLGQATTPGQDGDGNGKIAGYDNPWVVYNLTESVDFWYHLSSAKMIGGNYSGCDSCPSGTCFNPCSVEKVTTPKPALPSVSYCTTGFECSDNGGLILPVNIQEWQDTPLSTRFDFSGLFENLSTHYWFITMAVNSGSPPGVWLPADTYAIDSKIDDGRPQQGMMRTISQSTQGSPITLWDPVNTPGQPACIAKDGPPFEYNIQNKDDVGNVIALSPATYAKLLCAPFIKTTF